MKFEQFFLTSIFAGILSASCYFAKPAVAHDVEAIKIKQTHSFFGKVIVTASCDALRLDDKGGLGFVLVSRAPEWRVCIFRDDDKSIYSESFQEFVSSGLVSEFILTRKVDALVGPGARLVHKNFMGFPIIQTSYPTYFEFLPLPQGTAREIVSMLHSAYRTVGAAGFPVSQTSLLQQDLVAGNLMKGHRVTDLSTTSIEKLKVSSEIFDAPKNYAKAKSVREVVAGENSREKTDSLQDLFDFDGRSK